VVGLGVAAGGYAILVLVVAGLRRRWADPAGMRRRGAAAAARRTLKAAVTHLDHGRTAAGLEQLRACLSELAADLGNVPAAGLTPKDVARQLLGQGIAEPLAAEAQRLLEACDAARYGGSAADGRQLGAQGQTLVEALLAGSRKEPRS